LRPRTNPRAKHLSILSRRVPSQAATPDVLAYLEELRKHVFTGMVGGSDLAKQQEQLGDDGETAPGRALARPGRQGRERHS